MDVGTSSYYDYLNGSRTKVIDQEIERRVITIFGQHKRRYGSRRIVSELEDQGIKIGRQRVQSVLRRNSLQAIQPKSFVPKTTTAGGNKRSSNLLLEYGSIIELNRVWVGDITYLPLKNNTWCYLATWMDLKSRRIIGWGVEEHMEAGLVIDAFNQAEYRRSPEQGLIVHSDGGGQYGSKKFRSILSKRKYRQSMTRKNNHYDNAHAESLFSRIKSELFEGGSFLNVEDARTECFDYIEGYYNTQRKHSSLGYKTPLQFESEME